MFDFVTLQAIQKLMVVEFASITFPMFGGLSDLPFGNAVVANESVQSANTVTIRGGAVVNNLWENMYLRIGTKDFTGEPRKITALGGVNIQNNKYYRSITFDGEPMDIVGGATIGADTTCFMGCGQKSGLTDNLVYHTGRTSLIANSIFNQFKYRGIESLWGELGCYTGGAKLKNLVPYVTPYKEKYGTHIDETWTKLSYSCPEQNTYDYTKGIIKKMGYDRRYPNYALPIEITADGSGVESEWYGDLFCSMYLTDPSGQPIEEGREFVLINSMAWDGKLRNGLFMYRFWLTQGTIDGYGDRLYTSRMIDRTK
jgi:hypothetical protein